MLPRNHYFVHKKNSPKQDKQNSLTLEPNFSKSLSGKIEFDLGDVSHPSFETVNIKGSFPRLKPRFERPFIKAEEIEDKVERLTQWVEKYFDTKADATYFKELIYSTWLFTFYANPFHDVDSMEFEIYIRSLFWVWFSDDMFELVVAENVSTSKIDNALDQFLNVFSEDLKPYEDIEDCPGFKPLYEALVDIRHSFIQLNISMKELIPFRNDMAVYFGGIRWTSLETMNEKYSEETYKYWRRINGFCDGFCNFTLRLRGVNLSEKVLKAPSVRRMLEIVNSVCSFVNDIIGIKKDLKYDERYNLVLFKVFQKGIPLTQAVAEVCEFVQNELMDFVLLRDLCLREFPNDPNVVKFVDILEAYMDGDNKFYTQSKRHLTAGFVKLTD